MRRLIATALVAGAAASSQAQRVAPIGATAHLVSVDSTMAPLPPPNREFVLRPPMRSASARLVFGAAAQLRQLGSRSMRPNDRRT